MATSPFVVHDAVGLASYPCRRNFIAVDEDRVIYVSGANIVLYDCKASRPLAVSPSIPIKRVKEGSIYENVKFSAVEITALAVPRRSTNIVFLAEYLPSEDVSRLRILSLNENLRMEAITIIPAKRIVDCVFDGNGTHAICLAQDSEGSSSLMCWKWELALHNDEVGSDGIGNSCGIVAEKSIGKNICAIDVCPKRSTKENGYYIIAVGREYAKIWEIDENFTEIKSIRNLLMMSKCGGDINFIDCCFVSVASHEIRGIVGVILSNKGILFSFDADTNRLESVDCRALLDNGNFGAGKESFTTVTAMCSDIIVGTSSGCVMVFTVAHNAEKIVGSPTTGGMSSLSTMWSSLPSGDKNSPDGPPKTANKIELHHRGVFWIPNEPCEVMAVSMAPLEVDDLGQRRIYLYVRKETVGKNTKENDERTEILKRLGMVPPVSMRADDDEENGKNGKFSEKVEAYMVFIMNLKPAENYSANFSQLWADGFHVGKIRSMSCANGRALLATCGEDSKIRIWTFSSSSSRSSSCLRLRVDYRASEALEIATHPLGIQIAVLFSDQKLRIYYICEPNTLKASMEIPLAHCSSSQQGARALAYSPTGRQLAVAAGNLLILIDPFGREKVILALFAGHISTITDLKFSPDGLKVASCGIDGFIFTWSYDGKKREIEHIVKGKKYISLHFDDAYLAALDAANELTVFTILNNNLVPTGKFSWKKSISELTSFSISSQGVVAIGTNSGTILIAFLGRKFFNVEEEKEIEILWEIPLLAYSITSLVFHGDVLFSACAGGNIVATRVNSGDSQDFRQDSSGCEINNNKLTMLANKKIDLEARVILFGGANSRRGSEDRTHGFSMEDTALVLRSYLNERLAEIEELNEEVVRIKAEAEYCINEKEAEMKSRLRFLQDSNDAEMEELKTKYEAMVEKLNAEKRSNAIGRSELAEKFSKNLGETEKEYENKLSIQYCKEEEDFEKLKKIRRDAEMEVASLKRKYENEISELRSFLEKEVQKWREKYEDAREQIDRDAVKFEEMLRQQETECEMEILHLREEQSKLINYEREKKGNSVGRKY